MRALWLAFGPVAAVLLAGVVWGQSSTTQTTLADPPADADSVFLIRLGVGDLAETRWDGSVAVENGRLAGLVGYEMRGSDLLRLPDRWEASSRKAVLFQKRPMDEGFLKPPTGPTVLGPSFQIYLRESEHANVSVQTVQGSFTFRPGEIPLGGNKKLLGGRAEVEHQFQPVLAGRGGSRSANARLTDNDHPSVTVAGDHSVWVAWQGYDGEGERVYAQRTPPGRFAAPAGLPHTVSRSRGDIYGTAVAEDTEHKIWVVWSERVDDNWDLYARSFDGNSWSSIERLTRAAQPDTQHQLIRGSDGRLHLIWQGYRDNRAGIFHKQYTPAAGWSEETRVSAPDAPNCWDPSVAVDARGNLFVGWDQYGPNGYDVWMRPWSGGRWQAPIAVAATARFEAHLTLAADPNGRVWMAWDEAGVNWGKDFGDANHIKAPGAGLYSSRHIRMAVYENGRLFEPAQRLEDAIPPGGVNFYELPQLAADGSGRIWAFFRHRTPLEINVHYRTPSHYALWEIYASCYLGDHWSEMTLLPYSTGMNDQRIRLAQDPAGRLVAAWPTDRRNFRNFEALQEDVFLAELPEAVAAKTAPKLRAYQPVTIEAGVVHPNETADLHRIHQYVYKINGAEYRAYRGDMHRHTEFSWDGYSDGSLEDAYRYAIDAAGMDFLAVTEHVWGAQYPYNWWRVQKAADLYRVGSRFVPLFAYERSVPYPGGHRNIIFTYRGVPELDIQTHEFNPANFPRQSPEPLFSYLRRYNGISMPHTSGDKAMGTDWVDYDPAVEPLVEIYQGDRNNYESLGAWRSGPAQSPQVNAEGMVSKAWAKGYRLGVQSSSDHMAVHTSYSIVLAPENSRSSLVDAMRQRHAYAATDNIIVDFRLVAGGREYLMGEEAHTGTPPRFRIHVEGTDLLRDVEIVKDNQRVYAHQPNARVADLQYQDTAVPGETASFYYVRIRQQDRDGQLAWSSPIWVSK